MDKELKLELLPTLGSKPAWMLLMMMVMPLPMLLSSQLGLVLCLTIIAA